jgi:hypothetical protein
MFKRTFVGLLTTALALTLASTASADETFGHSGDFSLSWNHGLFASGQDWYSGTGEIVGSYFVAQHLSLGVGLGLQWFNGSSPNSAGGGNETFFHVGPRVGYDIPLGSHVSFWPQIGVDFRFGASSETSSSGLGTTSTSSNTTIFGLSVFAPILVHPVDGVFVGAGPAFYTDFLNKTSAGGSSTDNTKLTTIALVGTIGAHF